MVETPCIFICVGKGPREVNPLNGIEPSQTMGELTHCDNFD